jgi:hypothetical protein
MGVEQVPVLVAAEAYDENAVAATEIEPGVTAEILNARRQVYCSHRAEAVDALPDCEAIVGAEVGDGLDAE